MLLKHKKCGGSVVLDIAQMFTFKSGSIGISPKGISVGILELREKSGNPSCVFSCQKCKQEFTAEELDQIETSCLVCRKYKPLSKVMCMYEIPAICTDCIDAITGKKKPTEELAELTGLITITPNMTMTSYEEILSKKVVL